MSLQKQNVSLNFSNGLDTKTDDKQVAVGKFLELENSVFQTGGLLKKRNGFGQLSNIPVDTSIYTTTFNEGLLAIGKNFYSYSDPSDQWINNGKMQPLKLEVDALINGVQGALAVEMVTSTNGLTLVMWMLNLTYKVYYSIFDSVTGNTVVPATELTDAEHPLSRGMPKGFYLGNNFVIIYTTEDAPGTYQLKYFTISAFNVNLVSAKVIISSNYLAAPFGNSFDGFVLNNNLYIAFANIAAAGGGFTVRILPFFLTLGLGVTKLGGDVVSQLKMTGEILNETTPIIWIGAQTGLNTIKAVAIDSTLTTIASGTVRNVAPNVLNFTLVTFNGVATFFYEVGATYPYNGFETNFIQTNTINQASVVTPITVLIRSLGIASEAFMVEGEIYFLAIYASPSDQSTYFIINSRGEAVAKIAQGNAYALSFSLSNINNTPNVTVEGSIVKFPFLVREFIEPSEITSPTTSIAAVYAQAGLNQATVDFDPQSITSGEIGKNLNVSGGFVWSYDGTKSFEQGFFIYPDNPFVSNVANAAGVPIGTYWYQVIYEWTDNQGNIFRSAPSLPKINNLAAASTATISIPTLRVTYKLDPAVRISIFRYSLAQPIYYKITDDANPLLNNPNVDFVTFADTFSDSAISGREILYTTGGVLENISPPATDNITLFDNRLWLIDAEDRNLLWFSQPVIQGTPVEMSDLLTKYVSPTTSAQGSTGPSTAIAPLDDKLIIFKRNAIYYINGTGPDITGANSQYSEPTFITATVGCTNQNSIVFMPQGLMFQSDKGIWLLGRDLSTNYIGAPVEEFNTLLVKSAVNIPGTNQVRFTLENSTTLMYDYYYGQWGTFTNIPAVSSTLYENLHTYIDNSGRALQETPGLYMDGSTAVLMRFKTSWINLAGLQGYQRAYFFLLIGSYLSPHELMVNIGYDYEEGPSQGLRISPDNYTGPYGSDPFYGDSPGYGGISRLEQWRVFFERQKCEAFQITIQEAYDPSFGIIPGAGFNLSGLDLVFGIKSGYTRVAPSKSTG